MNYFVIPGIKKQTTEKSVEDIIRELTESPNYTPSSVSTSIAVAAAKIYRNMDKLKKEAKHSHNPSE